MEIGWNWWKLVDIGGSWWKLREIGGNWRIIAEKCREVMKSEEISWKLIDSFNELAKMVCSFKELAEIDGNEAKSGKIGENWSWTKKANLFTCVSSCRSRGLPNMSIDMRKIERRKLVENGWKWVKMGENGWKLGENWWKLKISLLWIFGDFLQFWVISGNFGSFRAIR